MALLEDHALFGELLKSYVEKLQYRVVGMYSNIGEALEGCLEVEVDLLICDLLLPEGNALGLIRELVTARPEIKVLVMSGGTYTEICDDVMAAGANGYLAKTCALELLGPAITTVLEGGRFLGSRPAPAAPPGVPRPEEVLSKREIEVLRLVAQAHSTKSIADKLGISTRTADHHRTHIMRKLHIHDVVSLTRYALRTGVATLD